MTKNDIKMFCFKMVDKACGKKISSCARSYEVNKLTEEVWKWWKTLGYYDRKKIITQKGSDPATVYMVQKLIRKKQDQYNALPWYTKLWMKWRKLCQK